ncbi:hypothetical protein ASG22_00845 [Chryseobacterium sp. Leaf405]|uniref:hypothetical protein n=1 Tax=Chryseobacterium sp. Leaf405 TaxID=1736367 RepID=UPI0006F2FA3C|nr:hypothetical protein [Chryseobacterium sp. Leaf405]KQT35604.1 hypothetical protein ASG22_00845 [Chryseobacterium sp. Leaf405]
MKNKLISTILLFLTPFLWGQKIDFNIKYSEPLAVFIFIQNLSENYPENVFKTEFERSKYNTEEYKNLISKFEKLAIDYSYQFEEFPYASKTPMQSRDILKKNLMETKNLNDFKLRSIGIVPNNVLNYLTTYITAFTPVYNELIYQPNKQKFEKQLAEITDYANNHQLENYFETGLLFYNSSWDPSIPFEIAFYPFPNSEYFTAQAFYNNFISAIQTNLKDYKDLFSVMLHETYHIIYNEEPLEVKVQIDETFKKNPSKYSNYAYLLMNEVLATALGNGYVYETLNRKPDANDWYFHKYIDLMAKKIYPLVKEYIIEKKSIDKNFVDQYIHLYEINFPSWINEPENIMSYRYVISENKNDFTAIRRKFRYRSMEENETEISPNSIEKMKKTPLTKIIIVSKNNPQKLSLIKSEFTELKKWKYVSDKEFVHKILLEDKSQLIIINQKKSSLNKFLSTLE